MKEIGFKDKSLTVESFARLRRASRSDSERIRFLAMESLMRGNDREKVRAVFGLHRSALSRWITRVNRGGPEGLREKQRRGCPRKLSAEEEKEISADLLKSPRSLGYRQSNWDGKLLVRRIEKLYGVTYSLSGVYSLLRRLGFTVQRPTVLYGECSEETKAEFKKKSVKT